MKIDLDAARPVPTLRRPSMAEMTARRYRGPVVLKGVMDHWPLLSDLRKAGEDSARLAVLEGLMGDQPVQYSTLGPGLKGQFAYTPDLKRHTFTPSSGPPVPFSAFRARVTALRVSGSAATAYMQATSVESRPRVAARIGSLPARLDGRVLWLGSGGQVVNLHWDRVCNFICMLSGTKRVSLFPFRALPFLYPGPLDRGLGGAPSSHVRLLAPDFKRFPLFRRALPLLRVAVLEPGDVLYVPPFYWHHVESFGLNVMVSAYVKDIPRDRAAVDDGWHAAMTLFHRMPAPARELFRPLYHAVFAGKRLAPGKVDAVFRAAAKLVDEAWLAEIRAHLLVTSHRTPRLPAYWRSVEAVFFDHFVFQVNGDPIPGLPGEFARMVRRTSR